MVELEVSELEPELETDVVILNNRKGGVGKSTFAAWLACILAALGFKVVLVDGDSQQNASRLTYPRPYEGQEHTFTLHDVVTRGVSFLAAMVQVRKNLWVVPASPHLGEAALRITKLNNPFFIAEKIAELKGQLPSPPPYLQRLSWWDKPTLNINQFHQEMTTDEEYEEKPPFVDFVIFDSPPNDDALTDAMLRASRVLIPINMDQFSIDGLSSRVDYVESTPADKEGNAIPLIGIFPNEIEHKKDNSIPLQFLADVWRNFPDLTRRHIHADSTLKDAWAYNMTLLEYAQAYVPKSRGMMEMTKLALEVAGWPGKLVGLKRCKLCDDAIRNVRKGVVPEEESGEEFGEEMG